MGIGSEKEIQWPLVHCKGGETDVFIGTISARLTGKIDVIKSIARSGELE